MIGDGYVLASGVATGIEPDLVAEVAGVLEYYGCDLGPSGADAAAHAILAARSARGEDFCGSWENSGKARG